MRKLWHYLLATRPFEAMLMIGFPLIGMLIGVDRLDALGWTALKFVIATYPLVMYVYCLNSYGGLEHDRINQRLNRNPAVTGEVSATEMIGLVYFGAFVSGLLYYLWFPHCLLPWLLIMGNWTLYSHPRIYAKARPVFGTTVHLIGGVLQFILGYAAVQPIDNSGLLIGAYFALVFAAGHLNHEVKDHQPDSEAGLRTNAVVFGAERVFRFAFGLFTFAFVYLLILLITGVLTWRDALPYLLIYPPHAILHWRAVRGEWTGYDRLYQVAYRSLFVAAGILLFLLKWWAWRS